MPEQGRLALVGEAWGADEVRESARLGRPAPFVGAAGRMLDTMLSKAGIVRADCLVTNVVNLQPANNDFSTLLVPKKDGLPGWPAVQKGKYFPPSLLPELVRLHEELAAWEPDLIIALGSKALWALCKATGLANRHGYIHRWEAWAPPGDGPPYPTIVIPTWHPASIFRNYTQYVPAINDLRKAREISIGNFPFEQFAYNAQPTLDDLRAFRDWLFSLEEPPWIAPDIETKPAFRSITHIGIGHADFGISLPLWQPGRIGDSYWESLEEEAEALAIWAEILEAPHITKVFQNGLYDIAWLWANMGIGVRGPVYDTRLQHFAAFPELPHSLAEIATTWMALPAWKAIHKSAGGKDGDSSGEEAGGE